ncbi:hypothetical protein PHJA_000159900 [Phtheirospermum japonicum]|uniref:Uncharacterized protein n=1 Tax=Phtheirospermum japonicum TaxID=374723 RepID=A0A830B7R8_9LAMI|nr:hypothetical protein PHJA_000159900 [Phtheirospermum japonicum]
MEKSRSFSHYSSGFEFEYEPSPYSFNGPSSKSSNINDPEMKRKKRIASYNSFTTKGKVKASMRGSFKWIKTKISDFRYSL